MHITPLLSWDSVHVGALAWDDARRPASCDVPEGVELRVEPAVKTGPLFACERPWEKGQLAWAQIMHDDGPYRLWYAVIQRHPQHRERLCYAESADGKQWRKPELGIVDFEGGTANNICMEGKGVAHFCVTKCPQESPDRRYRCMTFKSWWEGEEGEELDNDEGHRRLDRKNAAKPGESVPPVSLHGKMFGLNSPDGLHWTPIAKPILEEWHDTHNIVAYDEAAGLYRAYLRGFYGGRRAISYSETKDFENWPPSSPIHHTTAADQPDESLYSNCYTTYPGRPDIHLMFPAIYHQSTDTTYGQLAVSSNGRNWSRIHRQAIIPHGRPGDPDEGMTYPEPQLLRFPDEGKFRLLCLSGRRYHNEWYNEALREASAAAYYSWAEWSEDRLAGIHAAADGAFTIVPQACGDRLLANFCAAEDGWVRIELVDRVVWPPQPTPGIEGFTFADADVLTGDQSHAPVTWRGEPDLSRLEGQSVAIRVRLHKAMLFSVTMYGIDEPTVQADPRYPV